MVYAETKSTIGWTETRKKVAIASVAATVIGVYLNASFNYATLKLNRARAASDIIRDLNSTYTDGEMRFARSCVKYAAENLTDESLRLMWGRIDEYLQQDFPRITKNSELELKRCFSSTRYNENYIQNVNKNHEILDDKFFTENSYYFARLIFSYVNAHEVTFLMWQKNQADHTILCEQIIGSEFGDNHPMTDFLRRSIDAMGKADNSVQLSYPGTYWYIYSIYKPKYCDNKISGWFRNNIMPVLPFLN
jgi:hypothetical protein